MRGLYLGSRSCACILASEGVVTEHSLSGDGDRRESSRSGSRAFWCSASWCPRGSEKCHTRAKGDITARGSGKCHTLFKDGGEPRFKLLFLFLGAMPSLPWRGCGRVYVVYMWEVWQGVNTGLCIGVEKSLTRDCV